MATWLITGATGFLGRHVLGVLGQELNELSIWRRSHRAGRIGRRAGPNTRLSWPISTNRIGCAT